jgi:probable phosphomutase (TIGR03848 family)
MAIFLLIRHGENDFVGKRLAGHLPGIHLNEKGRQQAELIASMLCHAPIKAVYTSPLERAIETAEPLSQALGLSINLREGLSEVNFGAWQGRTTKQLRRLKLWKAAQKTPSLIRFPGGESFIKAQERVCREIEAIQAQHDEKDMVTCFSHSDVISLAIAHYLGLPLDNFHRISVNTASMTVLILPKEGPPVLGAVNQAFELKFDKSPGH